MSTSTSAIALTRRAFGKRSILNLAALSSLGSIVSSTGCSVISDLLKYIPVALQAISGVITVLTGGGIAIAPIVNLVLTDAKAAFADLSADITAYDNAPASDKSTWLGKVSTALSIVEGNIQQFWSDLNIPDAALASIVAGVLGIVVSTLGYFQSQLPAPTPSPSLTAIQQKRATLTKTITVAAKKRSLSQFKADINSAFGGKVTVY
jgi:hypothetical protein